MPLHGDLNRPNRATQNPFEESPRRISEYTASEIATLQSRLEKQLGPEYISTRPGAGGGKVHYLAAEKVINLANEVFGFNGWSSAIQQVQVDFVDDVGGGKVSLGLSTIVRVTLKDGTYHEDIGYGHIENCKGKATAFEKAKKEAATDALKRALRNFGNVLGNCLYDKDYLQKVTKLKVAPSKWTADNLHRHHDFAPIKKESIEDATRADAQRSARTRSDRSGISNGTEYGEDEFGGNLFDEVDFSHPDEVRVDDTTVDGDDTAASVQSNAGRPSDRHQHTKNMTGPSDQQPYAQQMQRAAELQRQFANNHTNGAQKPSVPPKPSVQPGAVNASVPREVNQPVPGDVMPGFVTGRTADKPSAQPFNPHAESPSIRRTAGINSGKSEPILRTVLNGQAAITPAPNNQPAKAVAGPPNVNFVNPSADANRRVGMPMAPQSPMANRGAYKPPTAVKRPAPPETPSRAPLADTTNALPTEPGPDAKKTKVESGLDVQSENASKT